MRPLINARGTFTIISGSTMLPEVRAAMDAAAQKYVHLDELTDAVGARLAALTGAEWGLVTNGCSAGLTLATAACVAGGNPDLHVRLPDLTGFAKDEAVIPTHSRNVYDAAIRAVGLRVVEVATLEEFEAALGPRTALVYIMAGPRVDESPLNVKAIAPIAKAKGVPILVDAAAEILTVPNVHLQNGATLVGYSGGKCLRGPQTGGLLLGRKDLVRAAWVHSAPHHGFARALKVGKEDAIGMLMAVEMWVKRDHDAEWKRWTSWLDHIAQRAVDDRRRDDVDRAAERLVESHAVAVDSLGSPAIRLHRRRRCPRASRWRAAHCDGGHRRRRPADGHVDHAVHDGRRRRARSSPTGCTRCSRSRPQRPPRRRRRRRSRISRDSGTCASSSRRRRQPIRCI